MNARAMLGRPARLAAVTLVLLLGGLVRVAMVDAAEAPAKTVATTTMPVVDPYPVGKGLRASDGAAKAEPAATKGTIVYVADSNVYLDDLDDDRDPRALTDNEEGESAWAPRFADATTVSFTSDRGLELLDLTTGARTLLATHEPWVGAYDWSPDGRLIAYMTSEWNDERATTEASVRILTRAGTPTVVPLPLLLPEGYCIHDPDGDFRVEFSPDGRWILVENVAAQPSPSVTVVSVTGDVILEPAHLAWARFDTDANLIASDIPRKQWVRLSLTSGHVDELPVPIAARRPAESPGGGAIAFDDGVGTVSTVDAQTGEVTRVARAHVHPVWLGDDRMIAFAVTSCDGCESAWEPAGHATLFEPDGSTRRLPIDAVGQLDVL